jgi:UDP-GlcNAc:undecaprenyl-phosphate GlcNAc-1-phosphate transferase
VAIAFAYVVAVGLLVVSGLNGAASVQFGEVIALLPAVALVFAIGLVDDIRGLTARAKLPVQIIAACLAYWGGVRVLGVAGHLAPAWLSLPITIVWLVVCTNAFNLIDGVDGLAAGIGLFATFTMLVSAMLNGHMTLALATAPLIGALLAFLRYNFNPASIFLGDSGSLTLGFLLGCAGALWSQKSVTLLGMSAPLMALAVPLMDTGMAVLRRFLRHEPIFNADRYHLHHRLLDRGFSPRKVALVLYGVCGVAAAFSLLVSWPKNDFTGALIILFCIAVWVGVRLAGYVEFDAARHLVLSGTFRHIVNARLFVKNFETKLAAADVPDDYWTVIRDAARDLGCAHVRMSLRGSIFEDTDEARLFQPCCTIRIPLSDTEYVNFRYPVRSSVRHAVAISAMVEILQPALARKPAHPPAHPEPLVARPRGAANSASVGIAARL